MAEQNIGAPQRQFDDLHNKLASRLRHRVRAEAAAVPLARPPCPVGLVVLELTRQEDRDEDLVDRARDEDDDDEEDGALDVDVDVADTELGDDGGEGALRLEELLEGVSGVEVLNDVALDDEDEDDAWLCELL